MPNKIKPRRSYTANSVPLVADLEENEMAVNWTDGKIFVRQNNAIVTLTLGGSGGSGGGSGLTWSTVPASATATGSTGSIAYDGDYIYVATGASAWKRAALSAWSPFTPASVTGLQLWLDASDATSLYDATSGGSLVAADGAVARWEDRSGNGRHAVQSTSGNRPLRKSAVQGGKDVLRFDGSNDFVSIAGTTASMKFLHSTSHTVFIVFENENGSYDPLISTSSGSTVSVGFLLYAGDSGSGVGAVSHQLHTGVSGTPAISNATAQSFVPAGFSVVSIVGKPLDGTASNRSSVRKNGGTAVTNNAATAAVSTADSHSDVMIGRDGGANDYHGGDIAEILIYNSALSDTDRAAVESYLMTKWGIT